MLLSRCGCRSKNNWIYSEEQWHGLDQDWKPKPTRSTGEWYFQTLNFHLIHMQAFYPVTNNVTINDGDYLVSLCSCVQLL